MAAAMLLDLTDEETLALLNLLVETIEADKFPLSPRVQILRAILAKFGPMGPPPPPPARPPTPEERDPGRKLEDRRGRAASIPTASRGRDRRSRFRAPPRIKNWGEFLMEVRGRKPMATVAA
jgi:hypothetical protein